MFYVVLQSSKCDAAPVPQTTDQAAESAYELAKDFNGDHRSPKNADAYELAKDFNGDNGSPKNAATYELAKDFSGENSSPKTVSYTHLTLPTNREV